MNLSTQSGKSATPSRAFSINSLLSQKQQQQQQKLFPLSTDLTSPTATSTQQSRIKLSPHHTVPPNLQQMAAAQGFPPFMAPFMTTLMPLPHQQPPLHPAGAAGVPEGAATGLIPLPPFIFNAMTMANQHGAAHAGMPFPFPHMPAEQMAALFTAGGNKRRGNGAKRHSLERIFHRQAPSGMAPSAPKRLKMDEDDGGMEDREGKPGMKRDGASPGAEGEESTELKLDLTIKHSLSSSSPANSPPGSSRSSSVVSSDSSSPDIEQEDEKEEGSSGTKGEGDPETELEAKLVERRAGKQGSTPSTAEQRQQRHQQQQWLAQMGHYMQLANQMLAAQQPANMGAAAAANAPSSNANSSGMALNPTTAMLSGLVGGKCSASRRLFAASPNRSN